MDYYYKDKHRRIAMSKCRKSTMGRQTAILKDKKINVVTKRKLDFVVPVESHGAETRMIGKTERKTCDAFVIWRWRRVKECQGWRIKLMSGCSKTSKPEWILESRVTHI